MSKSKLTPLRGEQLIKNREAAKDGRLDRELRARTVVPAAYADAIWANPDNILGMPHLVHDVKGLKKVLKALKKTADVMPEAAALYDKLTLAIPGEEFTSPLCSIARHRRRRMMHRGLEPFVFGAVHSQVRLETIVHGFSPTLDGTLVIIEEARADFRKVQRVMRNSQAGYLEVGAFEPDIRHSDAFQGEMPTLTRLAPQLGWDVPDAGGYVVSSHRLVRVARPWVYAEAVGRQFPGYRRIKSQRLDRDRSLAKNLELIFDYLWKLDPHINAILELPYRDSRRMMQSIFDGPLVSGKTSPGYVYDTMLTQWALFLDSTGFAPFEINYINGFARNWHSEEETNFFIESGWYDELHGYCKSEPFRTDFSDSRTHHSDGYSLRLSQTQARRSNRLWVSSDAPCVVPSPEVIAHVAGQPVLRTQRNLRTSS